MGVNWYDHHARYYDPEVGRWFAIDPALQAASPYMAMGNSPMIYIDADGRTWKIFKAIGDAWAWDKGNQFARWADENGIPAMSFGAGMNSAGQISPVVNVNGQELDFDYGDIYAGINQANNSLSGQLASLPTQKSTYSPLGRVWIPSVYVDPAILNGILYGDNNFHNYTLEMIIRGMRGPIKNSSGVAHTIRAYQPNFWAEVRDDTGFLGTIGYGISDDVWITTQRMVLQKLPNEIHHLDNSGIEGQQILDAGINTMSNFVPATSTGKMLGVAKKPLNAATYNTLYKGTGFTARKNSGQFIRQFNNVIRQDNGIQQVGKYIQWGGFITYTF